MASSIQIAQAALQLLDSMRLECDGVSRSLSQYLMHKGIEHEIRFGCLEVEPYGRTPLHFWVVLADGSHCDIKARMWLGEDQRIPHGVFQPQGHQHYLRKGVERPPYSPVFFWILTETDISDFAQQVETRLHLV